MKKAFYVFLACALAGTTAPAQLSITASDMPVVNDTLRWSEAAFSPTTNISAYTQTGTNFTWNFSSLVPTAQGVDAYKSALSVSPLYASISLTAYGYKVADSLPLPNLPINIEDAYTFFGKKNNPSRFVAEGFGAKIGGIPVPASYSNEDEIYFFPLTFGRTDTSTYKLDVNVAGIGRLVQYGTRITKVDGSGTIQTPYTSGPVACLRVRSEVNGVDSLVAQGVSIPIPRNTVEYKWLAKEEHYPLLWVTANIAGGQQVLAQVRYRDRPRALGIANVANAVPQNIAVYVAQGTRNVKLFLPAGWQRNVAEVFSVNGQLMSRAKDVAHLDCSGFATGTYLIRITSETGVGYAKVVF